MGRGFWRRVALHPLRNVHRGEQIIILGNGPSIRDIPVKALRRFTTIGVNEINRWFDPDYVLLYDMPGCFAKVDFELTAIRRAFRCSTVLARHNWGEVYPPVENLDGEHYIVDRSKTGQWDEFQIKTYEMLKERWDTIDALSFIETNASTEAAAMIALFMGASWIGVLGLDYVPHHFYGPTGHFPKKVSEAQVQWLGIQSIAKHVFDCDVVNLSKRSHITKLPYSSVPDHEEDQKVVDPARDDVQRGREAGSEGGFGDPEKLTDLVR